MAKKDNEALYQEFLADLKKINPKIEEILDDATNAKLKDSVLARAEFSRQSDELRAQREELLAWQEAEKQKIDGWQKWYGDTSREVAAMNDKLTKYVEAYGELDDAGQRREAAKVGLSKEDFEKQLNSRLQERDVAALKFVDDLTDLKIEHRDRFKEKLDTSAVYKIAGEKNLPLDVAYKLYINDRVEEQNKVQIEERVKREREEAVADFASKHNLPVISSSPDHIHVLDVKEPLYDRSARIAAAVKDFGKATSGR